MLTSAKAITNTCSPPPATRLAAAAIADRSAPMLMMFAISRMAISTATARAETWRRGCLRGRSRHPADMGADQLDRRHQREGQDHRPQQPIAELRPGLRIGRDAARIVVRGAGDDPGPERARRAPHRVAQAVDPILPCLAHQPPARSVKGHMPQLRAARQPRGREFMKRRKSVAHLAQIGAPARPWLNCGAGPQYQAAQLRQ